MTRASDPSHDDQLIRAAIVAPKYRIVGVEPHGWSTVVIEDDSGRFFVAVTASGLLTEIQAHEAEKLVQDRTCRRWNGDRSWTEFERLPLLDSSVTLHGAPDAASSDDVSL